MIVKIRGKGKFEVLDENERSYLLNWHDRDTAWWPKEECMVLDQQDMFMEGNKNDRNNQTNNNRISNKSIKISD